MQAHDQAEEGREVCHYYSIRLLNSWTISFTDLHHALSVNHPNLDISGAVYAPYYTGVLDTPAHIIVSPRLSR